MGFSGTLRRAGGGHGPCNTSPVTTDLVKTQPEKRASTNAQPHESAIYAERLINYTKNPSKKHVGTMQGHSDGILSKHRGVGASPADLSPCRKFRCMEWGVVGAYLKVCMSSGKRVVQTMHQRRVDHPL